MSLNTSKLALSNFLPSSIDSGFDINEILGTLIVNKWLIMLVTFAILSIGGFVAQVQDPIYEAEVVLQIEGRTQQSRGALEQNMMPVDNSTRSILTEIEIIKSRMTLSDVVENLNLEISAHPKYFPVIGKAIARRYIRGTKNGEVSRPLFNLPQFAWGNEDIRVDTFNVPSAMLGKPFTLQAGENGRYKLLDGDILILEGQVGKLAKSQLKDPEYDITLFVSLLKSRPETQFSIMRQSRNKVIDLLRSGVVANEKGRNTGIVQIKLEGDKPQNVENILNEIANIYVRQNVEEKSVEARKTLEFLEQQLPIIKERLDSASTTLNNFKVEQGSIDLGMETQNVLRSIVDIKTRMSDLSQKSEELRQKFTAEHPAVVSINKQLSQLAEQKNENEKKVGALPITQQTILRLNEEVQVNTTLYNTLLNKAQTLRVAKAGMVGDVRVLDYAVLPTDPIKPKKILILAGSLFIGLFSGIASAYIRKALRHGVENPDLIEKHLNIPVYATLLHSEKQQKISKLLKRSKSEKNASVSILALENKEDLVIEGLRSLRTTLHFAFLEAQNNIIMITGPSPGIGKSFVSVNLAAVLADSGKKVLLIDGDLRKGMINKALGVERNLGLSELISSTITIDQAIHKLPAVNFDFIATGTYPPNPSELLLHERFGIFLDNISKHYDHVIIDSPPILAVTDAAIVGRMVSVTLMVVKYGQHPMRELEQSAKRLIQAGVNLKGIVFNQVPEATSTYAYGNYVYQYDYKKASK